MDGISPVYGVPHSSGSDGGHRFGVLRPDLGPSEGGEPSTAAAVHICLGAVPGKVLHRDPYRAAGGSKGILLLENGYNEHYVQLITPWKSSMPTALRIGPYRFYFYSYDCAEPRHMHVDREGMSAKIWLDPVVSLAENHGYSRKELREIERTATENLEILRNEWDAFCNGNIRPA